MTLETMNPSQTNREINVIDSKYCEKNSLCLHAKVEVRQR